MQVNTLHHEVTDEIVTILKDVQSNPTVSAAVLISGKPDCFIAGADITMIQSFKTADDGYRVCSEAQKILNDIEQSSKPVVAAIQGTCLGGGLEVDKELL